LTWLKLCQTQLVQIEHPLYMNSTSLRESSNKCCTDQRALFKLL
jgi:hypothetical protein